MLITPLALACLVSLGGDAPRYRLIDLGGSPFWSASAYDVNERRDVVGTLDFGRDAEQGRHPVLWASDGRVLDLAPGTNYHFGAARSLNNAGVVVGSVDTRDAAPEGGFRWRDGLLEFLPTPFQMGAYHVDERGYIGGYAHTPRFLFAPTIWAPDLAYVQLPGLGGGDGAVHDINGWGDAVGHDMLTPTGTNWHAFAHREGLTRDLGTLTGHRSSFAFALNVQRVSVGSSGPVLGEVAVRWDANGVIAALPRLGSGGYVAQDINDHGEIVGYGTGVGGRMALLWLDGEVQRLDDLMVNLGDWQLRGAESINERGDIAGTMSPSSGGFSHAFLAVRVDGGHPAVIGPTPAVSGGTSTIELVGCTPGAVVALYLGLRQGLTPVAGCAASTIEIRNPRVLYGSADLAGSVRFEVPMPALLRGKHVLAQALELGRCRRTSLAVTQLD